MEKEKFVALCNLGIAVIVAAVFVIALYFTGTWALAAGTFLGFMWILVKD